MINITTIYDANDNEVKLPLKWAICGTCRGHGKHSLRIGAITQEDREDWSDDEFDDYMNGFYDERCGDCKGEGKIEVVDRDRLTNEQLVALTAEEDAAYEDAAIQAAELRMGC